MEPGQGDGLAQKRHLPQGAFLEHSGLFLVRPSRLGLLGYRKPWLLTSGRSLEFGQG